MKRLITFICLFVVIFLGYQMIEKGLEAGSLNISSYNVIETKSEALTKKLASYDKKNQEEYDTAVNNLNSSIRTYQASKEKYETIYEELADVLNKEDTDESTQEIIEEIIYSDKEKYKVDFLLVQLGAYGKKNGVDVIYQLTTSSTTDPNSSTLKYFLADLKFTVTGAYINVATFISDIENDDKLGWEISDFAMSSGTSNGYSGVSATFTIKDVPIDSESYLTSVSSGATTTTPENTTDETGTTPSTDGTTPDSNTTDSNTVSNTVTNTTTDTATPSNTVVNNTVN